MQVVEWMFGRRITPKERLRQHERALNKCLRELDQENRRLQTQENNLIKGIRKNAKEGQMGAVRVQAKDLARTKNYIKRFSQMRTSVQTIQLRIQASRTDVQMMESMKGSARVLAGINRQANLPNISKIAMEFEKEMDIMDQRQEIISDAVDDAMEGEGEEESEETVNKILDELGVDLGNAMGEAPTGIQSTAQAEGKVAQAVGGGDPGDDDLEARMANLRK